MKFDINNMRPHVWRETSPNVVIVIDISDVVAACMVKNYRKTEEKFRGNLITISINPKILPSDNKLVILKFNKASKV